MPEAPTTTGNQDLVASYGTSGSRVHLRLVFNYLSWSLSPSSPYVLQLENTSQRNRTLARLEPVQPQAEGAAQSQPVNIETSQRNPYIGDLHIPTYDPTESELSSTSRGIQRQAREKSARRLHATNDHDSLRDLERATKLRAEQAAAETTRLDRESLYVLETATSQRAGLLAAPALPYQPPSKPLPRIYSGSSPYDSAPEPDDSLFDLHALLPDSSVLGIGTPSTDSQLSPSDWHILRRPGDTPAASGILAQLEETRTREPVDVVVQQWLESECSLGAATRFALDG
jgi:hypothetical protein